MKSVTVLSIVASTMATSVIAFAPPCAILSTKASAPPRIRHLRMMDDDEVSSHLLLALLVVDVFNFWKSFEY
jgi:hypothetical protein